MTTGNGAQTTEMKPIPAGGIFYFSHGSYSDYFVAGVFRAMSPIDPKAEWAAYIAEHPKASEPSFCAWLFRKGMMEPLESWELHEDGDFRGGEYRQLMWPHHYEAAGHE